jgi:hypothetical protein
MKGHTMRSEGHKTGAWGFIVLSMMANVYSAAPQPSASCQNVIQLARITGVQLEVRQKEWDACLSARTVRKYVGYTILGATIAAAVYMMYKATPDAKKVPDEALAPAQQTADARDRLLLQCAALGIEHYKFQRSQDTFSGRLKEQAHNIGCLTIIGAVLFVLQHVMARAGDGAALLLGGNNENTMLVLIQKVLTDCLRLDNSHARLLASLKEPVDLLHHKVRAYIMRDIIIDNVAFVHSFEDWVGFIFAILQRSSLDGVHINQMRASMVQLGGLINEIIDHEEKFLQGQTTQQCPEIMSKMYNECARMAQVVGTLLYGNKFLSAAQSA